MMRQDTLLKAALQYQDVLMSYAYGILRDWSLAEDAVQDALTEVVEHQEDFRPGSNLFAWVRAITRNKALDKLRERKRERFVEDDRLESALDNAFQKNLDEHAAEWQQERMRLMRSCLRRLNLPALALLEGFYAQGLSYQELAERSSRSLEAIRKGLHRLRIQLRQCVQRGLVEEAGHE